MLITMRPQKEVPRIMQVTALWLPSFYLLVYFASASFDVCTHFAGGGARWRGEA
jgi:hypothetical protein